MRSWCGSSGSFQPVDLSCPYTLLGPPPDLAQLNAKLPALFLMDVKASDRFWEFFAANIRNKNMR